MAHEITIRADGAAEAAFAEKPAWHGLGRDMKERAFQTAYRFAEPDVALEQVLDNTPVSAG